MAALLLAGAAAVAGPALGFGAIGTTLLGLGATVAGGFIDRALFGPGQQTVEREGPKLQSLQVMASTEGAPIARGYGVFRIAGQVIWATRLEEVVTVTEEEQETGGKGGGGGGVTVRTTTYSYFANFAVGLCEGPVGYLNRVWADGKELDLRDHTFRFYKGTEAQAPDSLIETKEGAGNVPGYRGLAYVVFERLALERFGNRIPQLVFEVLSPVGGAEAEELVVGVNMIPGSTEFGYDTTIVEKVVGGGNEDEAGRSVENAHQFLEKSDWSVSLDQMAMSLPSVDTVCLVVSWFGTDLRCGSCTVRPKVETSGKTTTPVSWAVAGLSRSTALVVSQINGIPAFGGTPNDVSVSRAIADLKSRGYRVMFYPFIMMDVPAGNTLPNPYSNNAAANGQPVYPWRGRITCSPAPGFTGTPDKTGAAATQVNAFVGSANPGAGEWSFRRMILHYAQLCDDAGGVDYFCIGTEMVGLTQVRSAATTYPFVTALKTLAADVSAIVGGGTLVGYAADWSEYHSHRPGDGSNDVIFNLDPLWSDANIDFIGIDNYLPMSDWRDGTDHLDWLAGHRSVYDIDYLKANIAGGEYYDWFYANAAARDSQTRTPIADGSPANEPWVFANKRIKDWWLNAHHNRPGGVRSGSATGWAAQSKPIFFTEFGCPAIDKGTNQPNVFYDPKSESFVPYYSSGSRDDFIQRQAIRATYEYWNSNANNPLSAVYGGRMIDKNNIYIWSWDARPYPTFPHQSAFWADAANWQYGHWISARFGRVSVPDLLGRLAEDYSFDGGYDFSRAYGVCDGFVIDRIMSLRQVFGPLELAFFFDLIESGDKIKAISKVEMRKVATVDLSKALDQGPDNEVAKVTRAQETDLPVAAKLTYLDIGSDFGSAAVESRRTAARSTGVSQADLPVIIDLPRAQQIVDRWLYSLWAERERMSVGVLPSLYALEPGDVIDVQVNRFFQEARINSIRDGVARQLEARSLDRAALEGPASGGRTGPNPVERLDMVPVVVLADLPLLIDSHVSHRGYAVGWADPWPGGIKIYRSPSDANYKLNTILSAPGIIGKTLLDFYSGPIGVFDRTRELRVQIYGSGQLSSTDDLTVFAGANACAVQNADGEWEVLQFATAELIGTRQYKLTKLLRAQKGTEQAMRDPVAAGARFIMLIGAIAQVAMDGSQIGATYHWKLGPANKPLSSGLYSYVQFAYEGIAAKPLAPCHLRAKRDAGSGDIELSWIRRTRVGADGGWDAVDVPLGEMTELYRLNIFDGATLVRTRDLTTSGYLYTAASQATDWGGPAPAFTMIVYQVGTYGLGFPASMTV